MWDDGRWMMAYSGRRELNPSEQVLRLYFRNLTDLQPLNADSSTFTLSLELSITISRLLHPQKASSPMLVTLFGMFMLDKLPHPLKADSPMLVTPSGIFMLVKRMHCLKADAPMLVTLFGILMLVNQ